MAGVLGMAGLAIVVVSLLVWAARGFEPLPTGFSQTPVGTAAVFVVVGALLGARVPGNPVGWLFLAVGLLLSIILPVELLVAAANEAFRPAPPLTASLAWLASSFTMPALIGLLAMAGLLFPDGRLISHRWQSLAWLTGLGVVLLGLSAGLDPSGLVWYPTLPNPIAAPSDWRPVISLVRGTSLILLIVSVGGVIASLGIRYRAGDAVTKAQLRWIVSAAVLQSLALVLMVAGRYVVPVGDTTADAIGFLTQASLVALPLAAAFAITRYHLFGIDVLINRTLVYVPLMGAMGGLYALSVAVMQRLFVALTGETSDAALLVAVFLIAATFTPMRKALEGAVDRWARPAPAPATSVVPLPDLDPRELHETAARLVALRRLESRMAARDEPGQASDSRALPIDEAGLVDCPRGERVSFMGCLGCPHLLGIMTSPPEVRCSLAPPG